MGRESDYKSQIEKQNETEEELSEKAIKKLHKESLKSSELAAYLSCHSRNGIHFDSKKIKGRIAEICKMSNGTLTEDMFRKDKGNSRSMYYFPPESHGLLLTILDTGYFDDRKNDRKLSTRENLYRDLTVNVDLYLQEDDLEMVRSNPAFTAAKCEGILSEAISFKIQHLIGNAMNSDETIRIQQLRRIYNALRDVEERNSTERNHLFSSKMVYKYAFGETAGISEGVNIYKELFGAENLFDYLICLLAVRMNGLDFQGLKDGEKMNYRTLYQKVKNEEDPLWVELEQIDAEKLIEELKFKAVVSGRYQRIMQKAMGIFDLDDPDERRLFNDLVYLTRLHLISEQMDEHDMAVSMKSYEAAMQKDMYDWLREFATGDFDTPTMRELRRIRQVSPQRQKTGKLTIYILAFSI